MNAIDKARAVSNKLKKETKAKETKDLAKAVNSLEQIKQDSDLSKMYQDNAEAGADNLPGELPLLKIHRVGKSQKNELAEGGEPNEGYFFYKPTGEQFKSITCYILTISKGFRSAGLDGRKEIFNQIMGGVIVKDDFEQTGAVKPFVTYLTGLKLSPMWEFGKEARKYTKAKPIPIPMFALKIKLTTKQVETSSYGKSWIIDFKILRDKEDNPLVITDSILFQYLLDNVSIIEDTIANVIDVKTVRPEVEQVVRQVEKQVGEEIEGQTKRPIPF